MTKQEFQDLLDRYFYGIVSDEESLLIDKFYQKLQESDEGLELLSEDKRKQLRSEIYDGIQNRKRLNQANTSSKGYWFMRVAAAAIFIIGLATIYFFLQPQPAINYVTRSTAQGQKATVILHDGSTVKLNAESSITYPEFFSEDFRALTLIGEAYFEIKEDKSRPFIISAHKIETTVLGTAFNINAYDSSRVSVALVSGKVKVKPATDNTAFNTSEVFLSPGEIASYDRNSGDINIGTFDNKRLVAWKDGIIYLSDAGYWQVFNRLSKWYGVDFELVNGPSEAWEYSGEFKDMSLELVLNAIGYSQGFDFEIQENIVTVEFEN